MVAADKGYQNVVEALLEGGVDVNYKHQVSDIFVTHNCHNDYWINMCLNYVHIGNWLASYFLCSKEW